MKTVFLATAVAIGAAGFAYADQPGKDWMPKAQIEAKLKGLGYTDIKELEADDGHWEADASKDGKTYELHLDPRSGELTKNEEKHAGKGKKDKDDD